jgi:hypothetical protein
MLLGIQKFDRINDQDFDTCHSNVETGSSEDTYIQQISANVIQL